MGINMKFGIDIGHNFKKDSGAVGIEPEDKLCLEVGNLVIAHLKSAGHQVVECKPQFDPGTVHKSLQMRVGKANNAGVEMFVSIHFNAFNGQAYGTEVFAISQRGKIWANRVLEYIADLGFHNRGVKDGSHLYVVKNTIAPAILIECCFCDSAIDMEIYNKESMAEAIFKGLMACVG